MSAMGSSVRLSVICASFFACGCAPPNAATPYPSEPPATGALTQTESAPDAVSFLDREIQLAPFLSGFPYSNIEIDLEHGVMFFLERGDSYSLRAQTLPPFPSEGPREPISLETAAVVSDVDWSKRSLWGVRWSAASNTLWLHADEKNDEQMNLWTLSLDDGALTQVTSADYVYSFGFSADQTTIAFLPRTGTKAPYRTCLHIMDVVTKKDREVICDEDALRFTWSDIVFSPDKSHVYFNAQVEGDRTRVQLVEVDLTARKPRVVSVTDPKVSRSSPTALPTWRDGRLLFLANDDGYRNLYAYDPKARRGGITQLTSYTDDIGSATVVDAGVALVHGTPRQSTFELVSSGDGRVRTRRAVKGSVSILDGYKSEVMWRETAPDVVFAASSTRVTAKDSDASEGHEDVMLEDAEVLGLTPELSNAVVACRARRVEIDTFDADPATGAARKLHAFVLDPVNPVSNDKRLVMIRSFYGGGNVYNVYDNILCAAGITVVSASVRGSSGFGKDFYALNNRDLGGMEIVDLFWVARWAEAELKVPSSRVGVYGRSHGGYATMRAMTFPPLHEGEAPYPFGFGLAEAGFSDIVAFHDATNIPDWVVLEAGDPSDEDDKRRLMDRSPVHATERLRAPIFLLHGSNDWRVPVNGSRKFVEAARAGDKDVTYVEVAGQGHRVKGVSRNVAAWQERFDFLSTVLGDRVDSGPRTEVSEVD